MDRESRADDVLGAWYEDRERGEACAPEALIAAHPALADLLRARLAALDILDHVTARGVRRIPSAIGPHRVLRELGSGGMGTVYLGEAGERAPSLETGSRVAIKLIHSHLLERQGFFKRVQREAQLGQQVDHPNVVRTYDVDLVLEQGRAHHFLLMEYVEGRTLGALLTELDRVPEELCRHIATEVVRGLAAIHEAGAVHRDLKPENVLITDDHVVKIMDLGVAALRDEALRLSQTGAFVGSLHYAAPEQFGDSARVDPRTDLFGLGVLLYELSTGTNPFDDEDARVVMRRILDEPPRRLGELNPQLTPFFEELVLRLLAKSPDDRFASAPEVLEVLESGEASEWWRSHAQELRRRTRRPLRRVRVPRETAVYGRDDELARLRASFGRAVESDGRVILLEGEAGIGKTRVVDELVASLRENDEDFHFLYGSHPPGGAATSSGAFATAFREHFGNEGLDEALAEVLTVTPVLVPAFTALLRGEPPPDGEQPLTKDSLQTVFVHALRALAAEKPIVLLVDDLHFAPEEARALFAALALAIPAHRVLLVGTMRPGVPERWIANIERLDHAERRELRRLGIKDLIALLHDTLRSERLAEELAGKIGAKSDGNPFFVFEILRGLREGQFLRQRPDGTWETTQILRDIDVPSSVLDLVNARIADLTDDERNLLEVASCIGFEFDPLLVAEVVQTPRIDVLRTLGRIEKRHRLVRSAGRRFVFDHHQVQEALYGGLSELLREEYHLALAEALGIAHNADSDGVDGDIAVRVCEHYLRSSNPRGAAQFLLVAQAHLIRANLHAPCVDLSERALRIPRLLEAQTRAEVLLRLCYGRASLGIVGRIERAHQASTEALGIASRLRDSELECRSRIALGIALSGLARYDESCAELSSALTTAHAAGDARRESDAIGNLGSALMNAGRMDEAIETLRRAEHSCRHRGDLVGLAASLGNLGHAALSQGRIEDAHDLYQQQHGAAVSAGHGFGVANSQLALSGTLRRLGRVDESLESSARALSGFREIGDRPGEVVGLCQLGIAHASHGHLIQARESMTMALALASEIASPRQEVMVLVNLGAVQWSLGELETAAELLRRAVGLARRARYWQAVPSAEVSLAGVLRELDDLGASEAILVDCVENCRESGYKPALSAALLALGSLRMASGREAIGAEAVREAYAMALELGRRDIEVMALCSLAEMDEALGCSAAEAYEAHHERLRPEQAADAGRMLWCATGEPRYLEDAMRRVNELVAPLDDEARQNALRRLETFRTIVAAWKARRAAGSAGTEAPTIAS